MWKDSLRNNVTSIPELCKYFDLSPEMQESLTTIVSRFPMSISLYYLSLINWEDEHDPIRKMCIPSLEELDMTGSFDTSGETSNTKTTGLQHKYKETALILSTNVCGMYCRYCFRKRAVGISEKEIAKNFDTVAEYVKAHTELSNVLISGGDSFLMDNEQLEKYLETYTAIPHLDYIRFGTRTPVTFPERINTDPDLWEILKKYSRRKQIYVATHFNHPNEITEESKAAVRKLYECGVIVRNQTVLLKGVNDNSATLGKLLKSLTAIGVVPYYVFQCRPVSGVGAHFQVPLLEAYKIVEAAKNMQNGMGKSFRYVMSHETGKIEMIGLEAEQTMIFKYHQAKDVKNSGRIFRCQLEDGQTWVE
ncbi:lysine 2,3-aminomutase [Lachnospiraceae bacterium PM6-15]|uniref:KamA family radical SAM protein n=1 Tax=Ohessyouella blattaphilus TaxID=2949333 RepID=UPI003E2EABAC